MTDMFPCRGIFILKTIILNSAELRPALVHSAEASSHLLCAWDLHSLPELHCCGM